MSTTDDIKKELYKQKPKALRIFFNNKRAVYATKLENGMQISFKIPFNEMDDSFTEEMPAQLLIRWMI